MTNLTPAAQLDLELINRARLNPNAEAARDGIVLNEGIPAGTFNAPITADPKQVLAGNNLLTNAAVGHNAAILSSHVLDNSSLNPHTQAGDADPETRIANAGYHQTFANGQYYRDENIGARWTSGAVDLQSFTTGIHNDLFIDTYDTTRGHRLAMMDPAMKEFGAGVSTGIIQGNNGVVTTEDFGISGTNSFLTGAVYNDNNHNNFYDIGEALQGVVATVTGGGTDTTGTGGGWSVAEAGGTFTVTFSGGGLATPVSATIVAGSLNAKMDLVSGTKIYAGATTTLGAGATELHLLDLANVNGSANINGTGNSADNFLYGNAGNNTLDGSGGTDTAVYSGAKAAYTIVNNANGSVTVSSGTSGIDTLLNMEKIQFSDQTYTIPGPPAGSVAINDVAITEGNSGTQLFTFTVTRSGGTAAFAVNYATADSSATTADGDYVAKSGTLSFAAGINTQTISVVVNGDTKVEANETFLVNLSGATNGATISDSQGIGTITNDDVAAVSGSVAINDVAITEGNNGTQLFTFTVTRSGGTAAFAVNYATADSSATTADGDYVAKSGTLSFAAGVNTQTVSVVANGDTKVEADETFLVNLSGATNGATISDGQGVGTITNDDTRSPDLTASAAALIPAAFSYRINNIGPAVAAASTAGIYLSPDSTITTSDLLINTHATPALASGGSDLETAYLPFPTNLTLTPGTYYLGTIADYNGQVPESNDANNASSGVPIIIGDIGANNLIGTAAGDVMLGLGGNDTINGGPGIDFAGYSAAASNYQLWSYNGTVAVLTHGPDGNDRLQGVENIEFTDQIVATNSAAAFDPLEYIASYGDLIQAIGANPQAGFDHFVDVGFGEGRQTNLFDATEYLASNPDLIRAFGLDTLSAELHYITNGFNEHRATSSFDALEYLASNSDLIKAFGLNLAAAERHYVTTGFNEHRGTTSFDPLEYLASNGDLIRAFGLNLAAAEQHYVTTGFNEHRGTTSFDPLEYLASNPDLINAFGLNLVAAEQHYVTNGFNEHRATASFDPLEYLASNPDLIHAFGLDPATAYQHYLHTGYSEGRATASFDAAQYLANYPDLTAAFGASNLLAARQHYITNGLDEGRTDQPPVINGDGNSNTLVAKAGAIMTGGAGADTFVFNALLQTSATITDFASGSDHLQISASGFGHGLTANGIAPLVTVADFASATHSGSNGYFIFDNAGANAGTVYWDATGGAGTDASALVHLNNTTSLQASDFHLV